MVDRVLGMRGRASLAASLLGLQGRGAYGFATTLLVVCCGEGVLSSIIVFCRKKKAVGDLWVQTMLIQEFEFPKCQGWTNVQLRRCL